MESILTSVAEEILSKLLSLAAEEAKLAWGFKGDLKSLEKRMEMVIAVLTDAENKSAEVGDSVKLWLKNLKGAVYEAEAIVCEFQYEALRQKIEVRDRVKNKVTDFFSVSKNPLVFKLKLAHKIKDINAVLNDINKKASELGLQTRLANVSKHESVSDHGRVWGGDLTEVLGRKEDASIIVDKLLSDEGRLSVIAIYGMAGQGKTTLANLVCKTESVVKNFDKVIRVSVSDDFDETTILNHMAQFLNHTHVVLSNVYALVEKLKSDLKDKKYLLLLDDVWNEDPHKWKELKGALREIGASSVSKILVTTRSENVARIMEASFVHYLKKLSIDDSQTLFERRAFAEGGAVRTDDLVAIGKDIVKRCDGLPLAIDVLGKLLWSKRSNDEWVEVQKNRMWGSIKDVDDLAIKVIKLSYDHLSPASLKHCFSYCSIFPKDSNIRKDTLVQLWMALGLLPLGSQGVEDVGGRYFDELLGKSLLQEPTLDNLGNILYCKMHDLVHDIALEESKDYCLALTEHSGQGYDFSDDILHLSLSFHTREIMSKVCSLRLQTLILEGSNLDGILENLKFKFKFLRVLVLKDREMEKLPKWVGKMKQLRYLDITKTSISELPTSLTKLYNLQTLKVKNWTVVPLMLGNLVNLRHVCGGGAWVGVGKMTSLRTLSLFEVSRDKGRLIQELGELNNLTGELEIHGLGAVSSLEEVKRAKLYEKSKLQSLKLQWAFMGGEDYYLDHADTLEGLRPHPSLKRLEIWHFMGKKFSSWLMTESVSTLQNLVDINLEFCDRCEQVPTLGCLPHLKNLRLGQLENVGKIGVEFYHDSVIQNGERIVFFPALETLRIWRLVKLEEWVDVKEVYGSLGGTISLFPKLMSLEISDCKLLVGFPNILHDCAALNTLTTNGCDNLETIPDIGCLTSLQKLSINSGPKLIRLPRGLETITSLRELRIMCAPSLEFLHGLEHLKTLDNLELIYPSDVELDGLPPFPSSLRSLCLNGSWPKLQQSSRQHDLSNLTHLELWGCHGLETLPEWFGNQSSLQTIKLSYCKKLKELPVMSRLTRLQELGIYMCPKLEVKCAKGSGSEWHKIQHIPRIIIDLKTIQDI